jgi:ubiquinone biosynthesis protein
MLKKRLIPTLLIEPAERPPVPIVDEPPLLKTRRRHVLLGIVRWVATALWLGLTKKYDAAAAAVRLRTVIEEFGGLWVKVGQLISLRSDLMPQEFCDELSLLQHRSIGFPGAVSRQIIERELGGKVEDFFDEFEEHPFAAASISQVHRARLRREGVEVAIKVQRPEIGAIFDRDIALLRWIITAMRHLHFKTYMRWEEMLWEIEQIMKEELDYRYEAANIRRARKSFRKHKVYVPKVFDDYSTRSVLVMEYITGTLMADFIAMSNSDPGRLERWMEENEIKPTKVGRRLLYAFLEELLEDNLFHGDLHPGNIVLLRNSRFAFIDLGSIGALEKGILDHYLQSFRAMAARDYDKAADMLFLLSPRLPPTIDLTEVKQQLVKAYQAWDARAHLKSLPYHEKSVNSLGDDTGNILLAHKIGVTWGFLKVGRSWGTLDASLSYLIPDANYTRLFRRFFSEAQSRALKKALQISTITSAVSGAVATAAEYGSMIGPIVRRQALVFQGVTSKIAFLWTMVFRILKIAVVVAGLFFLYDFLSMYEPQWVSGIHEQALDAVARKIPAYDWDVGLGLIGLLIYVYWLLGRLRRRFSQHEVSPSSSGSIAGR